jgi:hypothetical protein
MATTRIKDISKTTTDLASDTYGVFDGATNGTQKMSRNDMYADWAAAYVAAPTTYKLAPLNSGTNKIDATYLPTSGDTPKGEWNASSNSPSLADGSGTAGDYYDVTTAGSQDLGSGSIAFTVGDVVKYDGSAWYKIDSVANVLDGVSTAATARDTLSVYSIDETNEVIGRDASPNSIYFNGSTSYGEIADSNIFSFVGSGRDQPFGFELLVNFYELGATEVLLSKYGAVNREWRVIKTNADKIRVTLVDSGADECYAESDAITQTGWVHIAVSCTADSAVTARADDISIYVNGVESSTAVNNASYGGMSNTAQAVWIGKDDSDFLRGEIKLVRIYNYAPTAAEWDAIQLNGTTYNLEWAEVHGTTETSDFSSDEDSFTASNGAVAGNIDSIGGQDDNLRFTCDTASGTHSVTKNVSATVGKRYRIELDYYIPSGQSNIDGVQIRWNNGTFDGDVGSTTGAWTRLDYVADAADASFEVYGTDGGVVSFQDAGGDDLFYIHNVTVTEVGGVIELRSHTFDENTSTWLDSGGNTFTANMSNATLVGIQTPYYRSTTFTPSVEFGGGATGLTVSASEGYVTRIGNIAHVHGRILLSAKGSSTGTAKITGLPYNAKDVTVAGAGLNLHYAANLASLNSMPTLVIDDAGTEVTLYHLDDAAGSGTGSTALTHANFSDTSDIRFSGTYIL